MKLPWVFTILFTNVTPFCNIKCYLIKSSGKVNMKEALVVWVNPIKASLYKENLTAQTWQKSFVFIWEDWISIFIPHVPESLRLNPSFTTTATYRLHRTFRVNRELLAHINFVSISDSRAFGYMCSNCKTAQLQT